MRKSYRALLETGGLWGRLSLFISLLACYGTLALVGLLSALGIALAIKEGIWAGAILVFAWAAVASIAFGARVYASLRPAAFALAGAGLLTYTLLLDYRAAMEIGAFALLAFASVADFRRRRGATGRLNAVNDDAIRAR